MGARVLVSEILNGPNDLIIDIRQQFSLSALHIQGSLGQKNCNPELGDSHNRTPSKKKEKNGQYQAILIPST